MGEAGHERAQVHRRRGAVLQGREGRGHVLHRQRPVPSGRIRDRTSGRSHCRRTRHAVAFQCSNPDAGMRGKRRRSQRQLSSGRRALRAESSLRILLSSSRQCPPVSEYRKTRRTVGATRHTRSGCRIRRVRMNAWKAKLAGFVAPVRSTLAELMGEDDDSPLCLPDGLPDAVTPIALEAVHRLTDYQGASYAQLYLDRLKRFVGRRNVDDVLFGDIARLMAARMSYEDPIRMAQLKLAEVDIRRDRPQDTFADDVRRLRLDEMVSSLPGTIADPALVGLEWAGWLHMPVIRRFSTASRWSIRRLKLEASLRRWRLHSVRYAKERAWVERWLHMIDRSLTKQPAALPDPRQAALKRTIAAIRARASAGDASVAAG